MHELGIVFHVIKQIEKLGAEQGLTQVASVTLELGEVSGVVPSYLQDCWKWAAAKSELMKGSELLTETIPAVTFCEDCGQTYPTVAHGITCPRCAGDHTYLVVGNEINIKEIAAC